MSSFRQILYHIVFRTKYGAKTLPLAESEELYRYIWGIVKNKNGTLLRINGTEDHIHILSDLHPAVSLADYVREIKTEYGSTIGFFHSMKPGVSHTPSSRVLLYCCDYG